jgi:sterol 24-C-methyltransferase
VTHGDFMNIPFPKQTFDHVYAIEATCHAPDRTGCYTQVFNVLKEGGVFGGYEWCMTDAVSGQEVQALRTLPKAARDADFS